METQLFKNRQTWQVLAITLVGLVLCAWLMVIPNAWAERTYATDRPFGGERICTATAEAALKACHHEARDDLWITVGACATRNRSTCQSIGGSLSSATSKLLTSSLVL
jgi:hypothetical protein